MTLPLRLTISLQSTNYSSASVVITGSYGSISTRADVRTAPWSAMERLVNHAGTSHFELSSAKANDTCTSTQSLLHTQSTCPFDSVCDPPSSGGTTSEPVLPFDAESHAWSVMGSLSVDAILRSVPPRSTSFQECCSLALERIVGNPDEFTA